MIVFIYGEDSYRSRQKLEEIIQEYKKTNKSGINLRYFDCEESSFSIEDLKSTAQQFSMFKDKKLSIVKNAFSEAEVKQKLLKLVTDFVQSDDVVIIYEASKPKESDALLKMLKKEGKSQEFKKLTASQLRDWVLKKFDEASVRAEALAIDYILASVDGDIWRLSNEIQKITNFKKSGEINLGDVKLLIRPKMETDIFKTVDAIGQKNKKQALSLVHKHMKNGDPPLYLLSMIGYQFRNLLIVRDLIEKDFPYAVLVKKSGLHPFVARKSYEQARLFTFLELKRIYQRIFEVDLNIKVGKVEPEMSLDLFIASL